jgi:hypothetical protein
LNKFIHERKIAKLLIYFVQATSNDLPPTANNASAVSLNRQQQLEVNMNQVNEEHEMTSTSPLIINMANGNVEPNC